MIALGGIVPEGLVADLDKFSTWEPADSPRAAAMKLAADTLRKLPTKQSDRARFDNQDFSVKGYRIDTNAEDREMRIGFFHAPGQTQLLGYMHLTSSEAYEFAHTVLKNYDTVEGIK